MDLTYLHNNGIHWRTSVVFKPNEDYKYFKDGVDCYRLFGYRYNITTSNQLMYHFAVIRYLNPDITRAKFYKICTYIYGANASIYND